MIRLALPSGATTKQAKEMKQWFSKHWTGGSKGQWTLRDGKQERPIIIAVAPDLAITDVSKVRSRKGEPRQTPEWRSQS